MARFSLNVCPGDKKLNLSLWMNTKPLARNYASSNLLVKQQLGVV